MNTLKNKKKDGKKLDLTQKLVLGGFGLGLVAVIALSTSGSDDVDVTSASVSQNASERAGQDLVDDADIDLDDDVETGDTTTTEAPTTTVASTTVPESTETTAPEVTDPSAPAPTQPPGQEPAPGPSQPGPGPSPTPPPQTPPGNTIPAENNETPVQSPTASDSPIPLPAGGAYPWNERYGDQEHWGAEWSENELDRVINELQAVVDTYGPQQPMYWDNGGRSWEVTDSQGRRIEIGVWPQPGMTAVQITRFG